MKQIQAYSVATTVWQYDIVNTRKLFFIVEAESNWDIAYGFFDRE